MGIYCGFWGRKVDRIGYSTGMLIEHRVVCMKRLHQVKIPGLTPGPYVSGRKGHNSRRNIGDIYC